MILYCFGSLLKEEKEMLHLHVIKVDHQIRWLKCHIRDVFLWIPEQFFKSLTVKDFLWYFDVHLYMLTNGSWLGIFFFFFVLRSSSHFACYYILQHRVSSVYNVTYRFYITHLMIVLLQSEEVFVFSSPLCLSDILLRYR